MQQQKIYRENTFYDAIKANDEKVLEELYRENYSRVERFIVNNSGTMENAKDVFQEAFLALWRNIQMERFYPENKSSLGKYLFTIAKNKWMDYLRSGHYRHNRKLMEWHRDIKADELLTDDDRLLNEVKHKFRLLGGDCRKLLRSFYYKKESMEEIAKQFDWTSATARNNKYRCLKRLREMLTEKN